MSEKIVIYLKYQKFREQMITLRNSGGMAGQAYKKIGEIRYAIELAVKSASRFTKNGESRIKNCTKYDLGDGYRLVTINAGDVTFFCFAGSHDETENWIRRNTGLVPVIDKRQKINFTYEVNERGYLPPPEHPKISDERLIDSVKNIDPDKLFPKRVIRRQFEDFTFQTPDDKILQFLQAIEEDEGPSLAKHYQDLVVACQNSDSEQALLIQGLISGESKIVDNQETSITAEDVRSAANSEHVVVLSDLSNEEVERLWDPNQFDDWMIYLHEGQRRIVNEDYKRPAIIGGVSGSGKTCVLLHRAKRLAEKYPDERILILTLNRSLSRQLKRLFDNLTTTKLKNVDVESYHDYVVRLVSHVGMEAYFDDLTIIYDTDEGLWDFLNSSKTINSKSFFAYRTHSETKKLWNQFRQDKSSGYNIPTARCMGYLTEREPTLTASDYLIEEFDLIRSGFLFSNEYKGYENYSRNGRSIALTEERKKDIIQVLIGWEKYQFKHALLDQMTISQAGLWAMENSRSGLPHDLKYRCVLVDEYQDFSTEELKLILKIPTFSENGLFLAGDAGQKIYAKDFNLPNAGLGPEQRDRRDIRKNYRNSLQILEAAHELLECYSGEGTAKSEGITILKPEYAVRMTAKPFAVDHEDQIFCAWVQAEEWIKGCPPYAVAIVTADEDTFPVAEIISRCPSELTACELTGDLEQDKQSVIVSDLNSVKGFEFSMVIIIGLSEGMFPSQGTAKGELWRDALRLYVAMTRARDELVLIYSKEPSEFLKVMAKKLFQREVTINDFQTTTHANTQAEQKISTFLDTEEHPRDDNSLIRPILPTNRKESAKSKNPQPKPNLEPQIEIIERDGCEFKPSVSSSINGSRIIQINTPCTVGTVAKTLNTQPERLIQIMREQWEEYLQPHDRLHNGYILKIIDYLYGWNCTAHFISSQNDTPIASDENEPKQIRRYTTRVLKEPVFSSSSINRCEMDGCNSIAMAHSSLCYTHNSK